MSTSQDENAILVEHIRDLQSKIEKDEKELNQLKVNKKSKSSHSIFSGANNYKRERKDSIERTSRRT